MTVRVSKKKQPGGAGKSARQVSPARRMAFAILRRVNEEGAFASPLLVNLTSELRDQDRGLCYELVLGVLRRRLWLDQLTEYYAGRTAATIDAPVLEALRLGLYQLRFLSRVPASAAVNESVNLAHAVRLHSAGNFINAVLRRATREPNYDPAANLADETQRLAVETSHPAWLIEHWTNSFGADETAAFARANNRTPPVAFRFNEWRVGADEVIAGLNEAGIAVEPSPVAPGAWRIVNGTGGAHLRQLVEAGAIYLQDEASQLVAHVVEAQAGERVLDVCAAPGSKATHMAGLAGAGALIVGGDLHAHRLRTLEASGRRQGLANIRTLMYDAEVSLPFTEATFDRVLVDAPCTGTGTLRHNPEIRWRLAPADFSTLADRQLRILSQSARLVRPGAGRLVYSTCSVEREENEAVVASFLAKHPEFKPETLPHVAARLLTPTGAWRTWPQRDDADGFFVAAFRRAL